MLPAGVRGLGPGAYLPRRVMTHMLVVATGELGDPVTFGVLVETNDELLHSVGRGRLSGTSK